MEQKIWWQVTSSDVGMKAFIKARITLIGTILNAFMAFAGWVMILMPEIGNWSMLLGAVVVGVPSFFLAMIQIHFQRKKNER